MADSDRVAGIYSEIKYKFDRQSIQNLRKFKRDLMELKGTIKQIRNLTKKNITLGFNAKSAKVSGQVAKAARETTKQAEDGIKALGKQNKLRESSLRLERAQQKNQEKAERAQQAALKSRLNLESKIKSTTAKFVRTREGVLDTADPNRIKITERAMARLNRQYRDGKIATAQYSREAQELTRILTKNSQAAQKNTISFNKMRTAVASATGAYSAFAGAAGIKNIGGAFEDASIMLETALGSEAGDTLEFLIDQSKRLGVGAAESAKGFARFALAGKQLGFTTAELKEQFLGVAEAATVFGLRQDEITGVVRALEQTMS